MDHHLANYSLQAMQHAKLVAKAKPQRRTKLIGLKLKQPLLYALGRPTPTALQASHHHANIGLRQRCYKQHVEKMRKSSEAPIKPMSLHEKRKRACAEYISKCEATQCHAIGTCIAEVGGGAGTMPPLCVRAMEDASCPLNTCTQKMWELILDLESFTDRNHNFIWRDMSAVHGTKRMRTRTKHLRF